MSKPANPDEVKSFLDVETPERVVLDRSLLEQFTVCPWQAHATMTGKVSLPNDLMNTGNEIHAAISRTIQWWIDNDGLADQFGGVRGSIADWLEGELRGSRPDVQPQAIAGARASLWAFADFLSGIRPANILHFDGGEGDKSSQLAIDLGFCVVTSELDLVTATDSVEVIRVTDWKSGWKLHTASEVANAFQFQMHADLLFERYKGVQAVEVVVWDTRRNKRTYRVQFERSRREEYHSRVFQAAQTWQHYRDNPTPWPSVEKCEGCRAALFCPAADDALKATSGEASGLLEQLIVVGQRYEQIKSALSAEVKRTKAPVVSGVNAFGPYKKSERAPQNQLYTIKAAEPEEESEASDA